MNAVLWSRAARRALVSPARSRFLLLGLAGLLAVALGSATAAAEPDGGCVPSPEVCDCLDNDCDGVVDNLNAPDLPPLCAGPYQCVKDALGCVCAPKCNGENECPAGLECHPVTSSQTGEPLDPYCVPHCTDCETWTHAGEDGYIECAPEGTVFGECHHPPVCVCQWPIGCRSPCFFVKCAKGYVCAEHGPDTGTCVTDNCFNVPCDGCDQACSNGICVSDPCTPESCLPGQVCVSDDEGTGILCKPAETGTGGAANSSTTASTTTTVGGGGVGPQAFGGCGCRAAEATALGGELGILLGVSALGLARRRKGRRAPVGG